MFYKTVADHLVNQSLILYSLGFDKYILINEQFTVYDLITLLCA